MDLRAASLIIVCIAACAAHRHNTNSRYSSVDSNEVEDDPAAEIKLPPRLLFGRPTKLRSHQPSQQDHLRGLPYLVMIKKPYIIYVYRRKLQRNLKKSPLAIKLPVDKQLPVLIPTKSVPYDKTASQASSYAKNNAENSVESDWSRPAGSSYGRTPFGGKRVEEYGVKDENTWRGSNTAGGGDGSDLISYSYMYFRPNLNLTKPVDQMSAETKLDRKDAKPADKARPRIRRSRTQHYPWRRTRLPIKRQIKKTNACPCNNS